MENSFHPLQPPVPTQTTHPADPHHPKTSLGGRVSRDGVVPSAIASVSGREGCGSGENVRNGLRDDAGGNGGWQKGVGGGGRRYKGLPLCTSSFYLLFEMARRERKRKAREEETTRCGRRVEVDG